MARVRVALVSDQNIVAAGPAALLSLHPDVVEVVGPPSGPHPDPDVVIVDAHLMLPADTRHLNYLVEQTTSRVLLVDNDLRHDLAAALAAGADGFFPPTADADDLLAAIHSAGE